MNFEKIKRFQSQHLMKMTLTVMIAGLLFLFFSPHIIVTVPAGSLGVIFRPLSGGTDTEQVLQEGAHVVFPWNEVVLYDARLKTVDNVFNIITKDGLAVETNIEFRYHLNPKLVGLLHRQVGTDYLEVMLTPEVAAHAREIIARYDAEDFYASKRQQVQEEIFKQTQKGIQGANAYSADGLVLVELDDVLIKGITLPPIVAASIERKVEQYHRQLEFDYRIQTEQKEAIRKGIEGDGVAKLFAHIGQRDIPSYLRLASIESLLKMSQTPGSRLVVVADTKGGVPIILNPDGSPAAASSAPATSNPAK